MTTSEGRAAFETVLAFKEAPSLLKVGEIFRRAIEPYGYSNFLCAAPPRPDEDPLEPVLFERWPAEWLKRYVARNYVERDPMVKYLFHTLHPFTWEEAVKGAHYSKADLAIISEPMEWGMRRGFVVPIYSAGGQAYAVTMAGYQVRTDPTARAELHLISMYAYARAKQLRGRAEPAITLSRRRTQALQWAAFGKTDKEIAFILDIAESTAHKHIEGAKRDLNAGTRIEAILTAIRHGLIHV